MRTTSAVLVAVLVGVGFSAMPAHATHPAAQFVVPMNGINVVSDAGVPGQGDLDAIGLATLGLDDDFPGRLTYTVEYQNVTGRVDSGLHIHGPGTTPLSNGPIFIDLPLIPTNPNDHLPNGTISATITEEQFPGLTAKMTQIRNNPSEFYIDLHTDGSPGSFPGGAIRGQLPEPGALLPVAAAALCLRRRRTQTAGPSH